MEASTGISEACDKMGSQEALAEKLGVSQSAVSKWVTQGYAPPGRIPAIAQLTDIPKRRLTDPRLIDLLD